MTAPDAATAPVWREVDGELQLTATARGRSAPALQFATVDGTPVLTDAADPVKLSSRKRLLNALPDIHQGAGARLLERLATDWPSMSGARTTDQSTRKDARAGEPDEPWGDEVDGTTVAHAVESQLRRYVVITEPAYIAIVLWIMHTYTTAASSFTPYLLITSPVRECGKSTVLEILLWLAHRAQLTGGITAAALYRRIDRSAPAMLLDELDTRLRGDGGEALRGVLNTGFHRLGKVTICVGDDHEERDFSTFCPKVLAGIGRVWDTVTSRSIIIRMERAAKEELQRLSRIRGDHIEAECRPFRRQMLRWAADNLEGLTEADPEVPEGLGARQADVWRPLLAIADSLGAGWPARARDAALVLAGATDDEGDYGLLMLEDVRTIMGNRSVIFTADLLHVLHGMEDRPWSEYGRFDKPITPKGLASLLGRFGVKPATVRDDRHDPPTGKGYTLQRLAPAFLRYLPPLTDSSAPNAGDCDVVTLVTGEYGGTGAQKNADSPTTSKGVIHFPDGSQQLTPERLTEERQKRAARRAANG